MAYIDTAIKAAKEAGSIHMRYFRKEISTRWKKGDSLVSKSDIESAKRIERILLGKYPGHGLFDEESGEKNKGAEYRWIVDPLDGTHNFLMGNPLFGVSIALEHKKKIILGVVYFPYLDRLYHAEKNKGAYCNSSRIHVSSEGSLRKSLFIFDAKLRDKTKIKLRLLAKLAKSTWRFRVFGVSVYHNLLVAEGFAGFNVDFSSNPWDHSAALLIVEEAGGQVSDVNGNSWTSNVKDYVASNGKLHRKVLNVLK